MPNELNKDGTPAAPGNGEDQAVREALNAERALRERLEEENAYLVGAARQRQQPQRPPEPDPLRKFTEDPSLSADESRELLDRSMRGRVRDEVGPVLAEMARRHSGEMAELENKVAYEMTMSSNPDIAADRERFAAAAAAVNFSLNQSGKNVSPSEFLQMSVAKFRSMFSKAAAPATYVEGAGAPSTNPANEPTKPQGPNFYEQYYGADPGDVEELGANPKLMEDMVEAYALSKNVDLDEKGQRSKISRIAVPLMRRRKAAAKVAQAASGR